MRSDGPRPQLILCGFFGRGNCGDEALLQSIYEAFADEFELVISIDEHGAREGFWDWYPYARCERIHQGNLFFPMTAKAKGMIVGGGGLPLGFVADQILCARSAGTRIALAGTSLPTGLPGPDVATEAALRTYLGLFDYIAFRSLDTAERIRPLAPEARHGADWALSLPTDRSPDVMADPSRVLVVLREFPLESVGPVYRQQVALLLDGLRAAGREPWLMPFCPEDVTFAEALEIDRLAPVALHWSNPRRAKQVIAASGAVVSVGRLHPIVFAADTRTPVAQLCPPLTERPDPGPFSKVIVMGEELGVPFYDTVGQLLDAVTCGALRPSSEEKLRAGKERLDRMVRDLRQLFFS